MFDYREDITRYSDDELSLRVFNDQYFYVERHTGAYLLALVNEQFKYTDKQMEVLLKDLAEDKEEE